MVFGVELRGFRSGTEDVSVFNRGVFGVELRDVELSGFLCGTEGCVELRSSWCGRLNMIEGQLTSDQIVKNFQFLAQANSNVLNGVKL